MKSTTSSYIWRKYKDALSFLGYAIVLLLATGLFGVVAPLLALPDAVYTAAWIITRLALVGPLDCVAMSLIATMSAPASLRRTAYTRRQLRLSVPCGGLLSEHEQEEIGKVEQLRACKYALDPSASQRARLKQCAGAAHHACNLLVAENRRRGDRYQLLRDHLDARGLIPAQIKTMVRARPRGRRPRPASAGTE